MYEWMVKKFSDKKNNVRASLPALVLPLFLVVISLAFLAGLVRVRSRCRRSSVHWRHCAGAGPGALSRCCRRYYIACGRNLQSQSRRPATSSSGHSRPLLLRILGSSWLESDQWQLEITSRGRDRRDGSGSRADSGNGRKRDVYLRHNHCVRHQHKGSYNWQNNCFPPCQHVDSGVRCGDR